MMYYEQGKPRRYSMRKLYRLYVTEINHAEYPDFACWLYDMRKMQILC